MSRPITAAFLTLGCKVNQYETDAMRELLMKAGYVIVDFKEKADVYIINTCSVTNVADRKSRQMIRRAKKKNPDAVVAAAGCYVQAAEAELKDKEYVDILIGNNKKREIVSILDAYFAGREKISAVPDIASEREYEELSVRRGGEHNRAYIKIQDGCDQFCSYCIIPYARGRSRSKAPEAVLDEVRALAARGYREVVLTGIHISSYGKDRDRAAFDSKEPYGDVSLKPNPGREELSQKNTAQKSEGEPLLALIRSIQEVEGIRRIRLGSLEPRIITEQFVEGLKQCEKLCPHFHLSLQSGCDATLKRMNRHYTTGAYADALGLLRRAYDHPALTTDVIVGFVGETEEEFDETERYLEEIHLYEMHIFKYSVRRGTRAEKMDGHVPEEKKNARSARLISMSERHKREYEQWFIGKKAEVLLEDFVEIHGETYLRGFTDRYVKVVVKFDKNIEILRQNNVIVVEIQGFLDDHLLYGKVSIEF